jgi:hypothetical protein
VRWRLNVKRFSKSHPFAKYHSAKGARR